MKIEKLQEILLEQPEDIVESLQVSSNTIPKWDDLKKQYEPSLHSIWNETLYPPKENENGADDFKRTSLALQKLAVNRISQAMFATPTERIYAYDKESERQQATVDLIEQLYRVENNIDSSNIERAKKLNTACQVVSIWRVYEKELLINQETSKYHLTHQTYSEKEGYKIFANTDENGNLLVVSIMYKDSDDVEFLDVYINLEKKEFRRYYKEDDWLLDTEASKPLEVYPVVYAYLPEPVWGGTDGTNLVEQLEEMESYQGMYIKRNALPTFTLDYGEKIGTGSTTEEKSSDSRRIVVVGKGGKMTDVTWAGADAAVTSRYNRIRNAFFEQAQIPDTSFANMITSNTSAENKELLFADSKAKARDLGGEWERFFYEELLIVKEFAKIMFSSYATDLAIISVRSSIRPYSLKTKKENAEYVMAGGENMSLETKVRILDEVDNVANEVEAIEAERGAVNNQLL